MPHETIAEEVATADLRGATALAFFRALAAGVQDCARLRRVYPISSGDSVGFNRTHCGAHGISLDSCEKDGVDGHMASVLLD